MWALEQADCGGTFLGLSAFAATASGTCAAMRIGIAQCMPGSQCSLGSVGVVSYCWLSGFKAVWGALRSLLVYSATTFLPKSEVHWLCMAVDGLS